MATRSSYPRPPVDREGAHFVNVDNIASFVYLAAQEAVLLLAMFDAPMGLRNVAHNRKGDLSSLHPVGSVVD